MTNASDFESVLKRIEAELGHPFRNPALLRDALTHRSFANEKPERAPADNERLEFLGDSLVGVAVATMLFERFATAAEGELTRRRAELVREASLAAIGRELGLGDALRLGKGEERQGGREKPRLLASALEACFGAVLTDAGPAVAFDIVRRHFEPRLEAFGAGERDFKSKIQELVQARGLAPPLYELVSAEGPDHDRLFEVALAIGGERLATARGRSKLEAEQDAASQAFARLAEETP
jgi:ribonuclease-3